MPVTHTQVSGTELLLHVIFIYTNYVPHFLAKDRQPENTIIPLTPLGGGGIKRLQSLAAAFMPR